LSTVLSVLEMLNYDVLYAIENEGIIAVVDEIQMFVPVNVWDEDI